MSDTDDGDTTIIRPLCDLMAPEDGESDRHPYLFVLSGASVGRMFQVGTDELLIGRIADCNIPLDDDGVSRRHASIIRDAEGVVWIDDLDSTNGTWVNGERVTRHLLHDGDRVQIGSTTILKYGYRDAVEEKFVACLYESATRDGLTGLYNKRFFLDRLRHEFAWHTRHGEPLSLVLFDIDLFKRVNDTHGHHAGDRVLKRLAEVCLAQTRDEDILARFGGEEFVCILRHTDAGTGAILAERLRGAVASTAFLHERGDACVTIPVTISVGVAQLTAAMTHPSDLIEAVDGYLYRAKQAGRNRVASAERDGPATK